MNNDLIKILKKKFSRLKKIKINNNSDLIKNELLDSLEMLNYTKKNTRIL